MDRLISEVLHGRSDKPCPGTIGAWKPGKAKDNQGNQQQNKEDRPDLRNVLDKGVHVHSIGNFAEVVNQG